LSDKKIQIQTATFLNTIAAKTKKQIMVYSLVDSDTNKDGKVDQNDIKSLYISSISGQNFTKLSEEFQELIDWNIIEAQNRLYFRCIEDINKNGAFDKNDKVHYYYVNLLAEDWKVEVYTPN
jgi:50S ribosomal subunit-associated GTPase HflX